MSQRIVGKSGEYVVVGNCPLRTGPSGKMSGEKMSEWESVVVGYCRVGYCRLGNCRVGKCPGGKVSSGKMSVNLPNQGTLINNGNIKKD